MGRFIQNTIAKLIQSIDKRNFSSEWKSTFKEEFVTAGGINLKEINFKTMESKLHENLYFAGEIVNIDAIGGFNFQNAWTSGFILANSLVSSSQLVFSSVYGNNAYK
jgi:predicted flavoprotein YhiN